MKKLVLIVLSTLGATLATAPAQELRTITQASGPLAIPANAIVQIVGVASGAYYNPSDSTWFPSSMSQTFADGTVVRTDFYNGKYGTAINNNANLAGNLFTGVTSISVKDGSAGAGKPLTVAVTVKIMSEASQVVSPPMILPVDDEIFSVSLETSTDMQDWVPAFPGDYLGSSNHRFFRVKAIRKPAAAPAPAPAATAK